MSGPYQTVSASSSPDTSAKWSVWLDTPANWSLDTLVGLSLILLLCQVHDEHHLQMIVTLLFMFIYWHNFDLIKVGLWKVGLEEWKEIFNMTSFFFVYPVTIVDIRCGDMVDAFATMMHQCCKSSTKCSNREVGCFIQPLILSSQDFTGLPLRCLPSTVPCRMILARESWWEIKPVSVTWPWQGVVPACQHSWWPIVWRTHSSCALCMR